MTASFKKAYSHVLQLKYWESAKRETFFARDNAEMFIRWCKSFGVRDAVLFESDGLVLQTQPRTVILCLLELSRLASKYGVLLPPPIQVPQAATLALEEEEISECSEDEFFYATTIPSPTKFQRWDSGCSSGPRSPSPNSIYSKNSSPSSSLKRSGIPLRKKEKNVVVVVRSRSDNHLQKEVPHQKKTSPRISSPSLRRSLSSVRSDTISSRMRSNPNLYRSTSSIASTKSLVEKPESRPSDYVPIVLQRRRSALDKRNSARYVKFGTWVLGVGKFCMHMNLNIMSSKTFNSYKAKVLNGHLVASNQLLLDIRKDVREEYGSRNDKISSILKCHMMEAG
ncbi:growth arrest-specific protein 2 [Trichonephila clavata]|uniref:Growth arrest-specific protein 2 n=1 Tax=Trichonephila clavata TaxID=2740835 RepID=A0A8X6H8P2_TRICU|nr:growth arrest-specific protein 2 [Trichonephila clavata]